MNRKSSLVNYLGQLRLYSSIDLLLLLKAVQATPKQALGIFCLWFGFLLFLESRHAHRYRRPFPPFLWKLLYLLGVILIFRPASLLFILLSFLYTQKNKPGWGAFSPLFRGLQSTAIVSAITSFTNPFAWVAGAVTLLRNLTGDFRDAGKDAKEQMRTLPVLLGIRRNFPSIHLIALLGSSFVWWQKAHLPISLLFLAWILEVATYYLTPR